MNRSVSVLVVLATISVVSCRPSPEPFPFSFTGDASGNGMVVLDRLTPDATEGIVVRIDLLPDQGNSFDPKYLYPLRDTGSLHLLFDVNVDAPKSDIHVYEFTNAVSRFTWHHGNYQNEVSRDWVAETGFVALDVWNVSPTQMWLRASVTLSNLVFASEEAGRKRRIDSLSITNVQVGYGRL